MRNDTYYASGVGGSKNTSVLELMSEWNDTSEEYMENLLVHQSFESQAYKHPHAVSVVYKYKQITYKELNDSSDHLARHLIEIGVKPDTPVGIYIDRSLEMVIGILAILKAGGAYVPLDPQYPHDRLTLMLEDARISVLLARQDYVLPLPSDDIIVVYIERNSWIYNEKYSSDLSQDVKSDNLAYVMYTSGSTGRPKGVAMTHRSLCNLITWQIRNSSMVAGSKTLQFSPISFDVSFQEIFSTLCSGGTIVLIPNEIRLDKFFLLQFLKDSKIERLFMPYVALQNLAEAAYHSKIYPDSLREVITAGEQLRVTRHIVDFFTKLDNCILVNQYGPTETHVVTSYCLTGKPNQWSNLPPIGRPIANTQIYILDPNLNHVPVGSSGELYIGGDCLARGYLNCPDITREKFISNPFSDKVNSRMYRTGDIARFRPNGLIEFIGRTDYQVKVRGYRIELGEIEKTIIDFPGIKQAIAIVREEKNQEKYIVVYMVKESKQGQEVTNDCIRKYLEEKLPDYMIPSFFITLSELPLTPSGKMDREALPKPERSVLGLNESYVAPRNDSELQLEEIWKDVLGLNRIGVNDNFFMLGGNSLKVITLVARINDFFNIHTTIRTLFLNPTIASFAKILHNKSFSLLDNSQNSHALGILFPILSNGNRLPVYIMSGAHSNENDYLRFIGSLIPYLGMDQPSFGLRPRGSDGKEKGFNTVEEIANDYLNEILKSQPEGPYILIGNCDGGIIAFELAHQLKRLNKEVGLLILMDTIKPSLKQLTDYKKEQSFKNRFIRLYYKLQQVKNNNWLTIIRWLNNRFLYHIQIIEKYRVLNRINREFNRYNKAVWKYTPKKYEGTITLFLSETEQASKHDYSWDEYTAEELETIIVPGNHITRISEFGHEFGQKIRKCIDKKLLEIDTRQ